MEKQVYRLGVDKQPHISRYQLLVQQLYALPFVSKLFEGAVKNALHLDKSVSILRGFLCATPYLEVGAGTGLANLYIHANGKVRIGEKCSISKGCTIITGSHDLKDFGINIKKSVTLDDYSWLAFGVTVLPGVSIGRGAVVGAKAVVTKDVPPYAVVAGNPARIIKYRMSVEEILEFEKTRFAEDARYSREQLQAIIKV